MALPILDGNQSATTLSTILSGGEHTPAHTVVSLGSTAISNIASAVSGSVVSISNFPQSQSTTFGAVTGSISVLNFPATQPVSLASVPTHGVTLTSTTVTVSSLPSISGTVTISNFPSTQAVAGTVTANVNGTIPVSLASVPTHGVTLVSTTVTVSSLPNIAGTVTANINGTVPVSGTFWQSTQPVSLNSVPTHGVTIASLPASTVTISNFPASQTVAGSVTANLSSNQQLSLAQTFIDQSDGYGAFSVNIAGASQSLSIFGTVTANVPSTTVTISSLPRPTWTDYSGTITTAGTAVTAISTITRSYLLAQVTTGQMFLNIGATATTLNSVYFSAGQGFAWETSVPQGIVSIISTVTGTNYVLKAG